MHGKTSDVVRVCLKGRDLFMRVIVEDPELEVVGACDKPVLAGNEANAADRHLRDLERLDQCAGVMIIDVDCAVVETGEDPGLGGMEVYAFYAVRTSEEFPLDRV